MRSAAAALLLALAATPALAVEPNIYLNRSEWFATLAGNGETGKRGPDRSFDVVETLDLDVDEQVSSLDFFLRLGKSRFMLSWNQARYSGEELLDDPLVFEGTTYPAGNKLRSVLHYNRWRLIYGRPVVNRQRIAVGFLFGLEDYLIEQDARMQGVPKETSKVDSRVPIIGASVVLHPIRYLRVYGEVTATNMKAGGVDSTLLGVLARVEYDLYAELLAISFGYRYAIAEVEDDDEAFYDLDQRGISAGLTLKL